MDGVHRSVPNVADPDGRFVRLGVDKLPEIAELRADYGSRRIVDEDPELDRRILPPQRRPTRDWTPVVSLADYNVVHGQLRIGTVVLPFHRDHNMYRHAGRPGPLTTQKDGRKQRQ